MPGMRLALAIIIIFIIIPAIYCSFTIFGNDIIALENGAFIEVENAWQIDNTVFYVAEGQMKALPKPRVKQVIRGDYAVSHVPGLIGYHLIHSPRNALELLLLMLLAATLAALYQVAAAAKVRRISRRPLPPVAEPAVETRPSFPGSEHLRFDFGLQIVRFFLNVFRYQINAPDNAPVHITSDEKEPTGGNYTYKLHVQHNGQWQSRRMTIGPIGEKSRSKSTCYYVIYDSRMVIKVPPKPLLDFRKYIKHIDAEKHIALRIAPMQCLIPTLSSILRRIYKFPDESNLTREQLERNYLSLLENRPDLAGFLTISGSHAYFMDVARYYFLGPIVETMHEKQKPVHDEILHHPDIFWQPHDFYGRYGTDAEPVRRQIIGLHEKFQRRLNLLERPGKLSPQALSERGQIWLLKALAGVSVKEMARDLPVHFRKDLSLLIEKLAAENSQAIQAYRALIHDYVHRVRLNRHMPRMRSMITNLFKMLAWLGEKGVAIRDLKPDNLLVVGDPDRYPFFLNSAEEFSLGLIDLETAVDFAPPIYRRMAQPLLGGTLYYATPTHFLANKILENRFADIRRVFYLQDWYAAIGIIYELITGDYLFKMAARQLNQTLHAARENGKTKGGASRLLKLSRSEFWRTASAELDNRGKKHADKLSQVLPALPEEFRQWLTYELETTVKQLRRLSAASIHAQSVFQAEHDKERLLKLSLEELENMIHRYKNPAGGSQLPAEARKQALHYFKKLLTYRRDEKMAKDSLKTLAHPGISIQAGHIMKIMFLVVQYGMRPKP